MYIAQNLISLKSSSLSVLYDESFETISIFVKNGFFFGLIITYVAEKHRIAYKP